MMVWTNVKRSEKLSIVSSHNVPPCVDPPPPPRRRPLKEILAPFSVHRVRSTRPLTVPQSPCLRTAKLIYKERSKSIEPRHSLAPVSRSSHGLRLSNTPPFSHQTHHGIHKPKRVSYVNSVASNECDGLPLYRRRVREQETSKEGSRATTRIPLSTRNASNNDVIGNRSTSSHYPHPHHQFNPLNGPAFRNEQPGSNHQKPPHQSYTYCTRKAQEERSSSSRARNLGEPHCAIHPKLLNIPFYSLQNKHRNQQNFPKHQNPSHNINPPMNKHIPKEWCPSSCGKLSNLPSRSTQQNSLEQPKRLSTRYSVDVLHHLTRDNLLNQRGLSSNETAAAVLRTSTSSNSLKEGRIPTQNKASRAIKPSSTGRPLNQGGPSGRLNVSTHSIPAEKVTSFTKRRRSYTGKSFKARTPLANRNALERPNPSTNRKPSDASNYSTRQKPSHQRDTSSNGSSTHMFNRSTNQTPSHPHNASSRRKAANVVNVSAERNPLNPSDFPNTSQDGMAPKPLMYVNAWEQRIPSHHRKDCRTWNASSRRVPSTTERPSYNSKMFKETTCSMMKRCFNEAISPYNPQASHDVNRSTKTMCLNECSVTYTQVSSNDVNPSKNTNALHQTSSLASRRRSRHRTPAHHRDSLHECTSCSLNRVEGPRSRNSASVLNDCTELYPTRSPCHNTSSTEVHDSHEQTRFTDLGTLHERHPRGNENHPFEDAQCNEDKLSREETRSLDSLIMRTPSYYDHECTPNERCNANVDSNVMDILFTTEERRELNIPSGVDVDMLQLWEQKLNRESWRINDSERRLYSLSPSLHTTSLSREDSSPVYKTESALENIVSCPPYPEQQASLSMRSEWDDISSCYMSNKEVDPLRETLENEPLCVHDEILAPHKDAGTKKLDHIWRSPPLSDPRSGSCAIEATGHRTSQLKAAYCIPRQCGAYPRLSLRQPPLNASPISEYTDDCYRPGDTWDNNASTHRTPCDFGFAHNDLILQPHIVTTDTPSNTSSSPNQRHKLFQQTTTLQSNTLQSSTLQRSTLQRSTLQSSTLQSSTLQSSTLQSSTLQSSTLQSSTLQSSTLQSSSPDEHGEEAHVRPLYPDLQEVDLPQLEVSVIGAVGDDVDLSGDVPINNKDVIESRGDCPSRRCKNSPLPKMGRGSLVHDSSLIPRAPTVPPTFSGISGHVLPGVSLIPKPSSISRVVSVSRLSGGPPTGFVSRVSPFNTPRQSDTESFDVCHEKQACPPQPDADLREPINADGVVHKTPYAILHQESPRSCSEINVVLESHLLPVKKDDVQDSQLIAAASASNDDSLTALLLQSFTPFPHYGTPSSFTKSTTPQPIPFASSIPKGCTSFNLWEDDTPECCARKLDTDQPVLLGRYSFIPNTHIVRRYANPL